MVTVIKKGISKEEVQKILSDSGSNTSVSKSFNAKKYCGKVKFKQDALDIQKRLRDEWE